VLDAHADPDHILCHAARRLRCRGPG
jgi:hypothetical protein